MESKNDDLEQGIVSGTLCDDDDEVILGSEQAPRHQLASNGTSPPNDRADSASPVVHGRIVSEDKKEDDECKDDRPIVRSTSPAAPPRGDVDMQIRASTHDIEASRARPPSQRYLNHANFSFRESFRESNLSRREDPPDNFLGFMTHMGQMHRNPFQVPQYA